MKFKDNNWPKISIVTPSYNQGDFIEETILSVISQNYPNLEYIIMDGGSKDKTLSIIEKYKKFINYFESKPDNGQAHAIKKGFEKSTGEILAWINSDDRYLPGTFERVALFFKKNPKVVFGNSDVNLIDKDGNLIKRIFVSKPLRIVTANLGVNSWPQQGCFWRKYAYYKVGGVDPSFEFTMDRDLFLRLTAIGPSKRIPGINGEFRIHEEAKSNVIFDTGIKDGLRCIEKYKSHIIYHFPIILKLLWWFWRKPTSIRKLITTIKNES